MRILNVTVVGFLVWQSSVFGQSEVQGSNLQKLCPTLVLDYEYDLTFTDTERRMVCGSPGVKSWETIPLRQAEYHMANFLSARGYHKPKFEIVQGKLFVKPGIATLITSLRLQPDIPELGIDQFWLPRGRPLTPQALNTIESWASTKLGRLGYPCAVVETLADPDTGAVDVRIDLKELWTFNKIDAEPIPDVRGGMLDRYRAFELGDRYDSTLLEVSADRLKTSQVVINTQYAPECQGELGLIKQRTLPGKPRLVSFGFGFDSENLFIVKASWRNSRLTETASLLDLSSSLSYRTQKILGTFDWYYLPVPSHHYLKSYIRLEREYERAYETNAAKAVFAPAWTGDALGIRGDIYLGPSLQFESTIRGEGPKITRLLTMDFGIAGESHLFEYFRTSPQSGYQFNLFGSMTNKGAGSDVSASSYSVQLTRLWNLLSLEPEIWIFGLRGSFASTVPGSGTDEGDLPPSYKYFLGGSDDMRGFARKSLPSEGAGALTKAYVGTELRLNNSLPYKLQPLLFTDWGWLGDRPVRLIPRMYWSPGLGLRWESPIGVLRGSVGHGFVSGKDHDKFEDLATWQLYLSIGEQF